MDELGFVIEIKIILKNTPHSLVFIIIIFFNFKFIKCILFIVFFSDHSENIFIF